ncbi:ABC transporter permease [Listeria costaricensis]|uniref:ABC transporter permease n=1 Tax=Listeria costaricensis TaxID=2026604 RepID=UPI000C06FA7E|nr:ABC transporter permease [Listeria costaricensis]
MSTNRQILELFKINLLYANPQVTEKHRKKGKNSASIYKSILWQYVFLGVLFIVLYGATMSAINFVEYPGFFTFYNAMFFVLGFSQAVSIMFNVFYNSKDIKDYLPLPFKQSSVFIAKFLIVGLAVVPFLLPVMALYLLTAIRGPLPLLVGIVWSLLIFVLFALLSLGVSILIISALTRTKIFDRYKNIVTTALLLIPTIGMVVGIMYINQKQASFTFGEVAIPDQTVLPPFLPFHQLLIEPLSLNGVLSLIVILALLVLLFLLVKQWVIPGMYQFSTGGGAASRSGRKARTSGKSAKPTSLDRKLLHYNLGLIKNPTLLMQTITTVFMMPLIFLFPFAFGSGMTLSGISNIFWIATFLGGIIFALFTLNGNSIAGVIISLDGENYHYFKSLPLDFKHYLKVKFRFAFLIQLVLTSIVLLITGFVLHLPWLLSMSLLAGNLLGTFLGSEYYYFRDFRLLTLNWTAISQLFNRGGGSFAIVLLLFCLLIVGVASVGITVAMLMLLPFPKLIGGIIFGLVLLGCFFVQLYYQKNYWKRL